MGARNIQKSFSIPTYVHPTSLLGPKDSFLNAIREDSSAKISVENDVISMFGTQKEINRIEDVLNRMLEVLGQGTELNKEDVFLYLSQSKNGNLYHPTDNEDIILSMGKKIVRAKSQKQVDYVNTILSNIITFCLGPAGTAKALSHGTMIPMFDGTDKDIADIKIGDVVIGQDGKPTKVIGVFPQGVKKEYKVSFEDGRYSLCSAEHLWSVYVKSHGVYKNRIMTTEQIITKGVKTNQTNKCAAGNRFSISYNKAVEYPEKKYDIHPYVMGAFLGDGCCKEKPLTISSDDVEIVEKIAELIGSDGYKKNSEFNYSWTFPLKEEDYYYVYNKKLQKEYIHKRFETERFFKQYKEEVCTYAINKRIPREYLYGSVEQRLELLRGLLDTDGSISTPDKGRVSFCSTSYQLCKDVVQLVQSLGYSASWRKPRSKKGRENILYCISISCAPEDKKLLFYLPRKVQRAEEYEKRVYNLGKVHRKHKLLKICDIQPTGREVPMTCIMVDNEDHLFLTQDYIVTHNTYLASITALKMLQEKSIKRIILTRPNVSLANLSIGFLPGSSDEKLAGYVNPLLSIFKEFLGEERMAEYMEKGSIEILPLEFIRGYSFSDGCFIICDETQNLKTSTFLSILTRVGQNTKLVLLGDKAQSDIGNDSGLEFTANLLKDVDDLAVFKFTAEDIVRSKIVKDVLREFEKAGLA